MAELYSTLLGTVEGLRRGLTSGSCAQAAARAALELLLSGEKKDSVTITLPRGNTPYSGKEIAIPVERAELVEDRAIACIKKDSGDDTDITNGTLIGAEVRFTEEAGVVIDGGEGVGRITKPGVAGRVGEAAINPVPRKMIERELLALLAEHSENPERRGCHVTIFVPEGRRLADETWNSRIGIEGGISIIGTKGVVEPKSENAYKMTLQRVILSYRKAGLEEFIITPGYVGEKYLTVQNVPLSRAVTVGDHVGFALKETAARGAKRIVLVGHIGKLVKLSVGIFNTHWKSGDARLEVMAACAAACGAKRGLVQQIMASRLAEDAVGLIDNAGLQETYMMICERILERTAKFLRDTATPEKREALPELGCVLLNLAGDELCLYPPEVKEWQVMRGEM